MHRHMLKSKIHRAIVTACDPDYVRSVTLDAELMREADLLPNEQVHSWDVDNGARVVTYALEGEPGPGQVQINGASARVVDPGDKVIVVSYGTYEDAQAAECAPLVVHVDDENRIVGVDHKPEAPLEEVGS